MAFGGKKVNFGMLKVVVHIVKTRLLNVNQLIHVARTTIGIRYTL